jgi:TolA-binding protein
MENVAQLPLSHRLWAWFEINRKQVISGAIIALAAALVIAFLIYQRDQTATEASEALSNVIFAQINAANSGSGASPAAYLKVAAAYPKSAAAARAVLLAGTAYFAEGKYDDAKAQFERFLRENRENPSAVEALLGIASCLDAQGKTADATTAYKDLIDRHPNAPVVPQAKFALAELYAAQNKKDLARSLYEDVERSNPYGSLGSEAGMRLEELEPKESAVVPAPSAPAIAPLKLERK